MKLAKFIASISLVLTIAFVAALAQQTPGAQLAADACDRLAASPYDNARPAGIQGVGFEQLDAAAAIEACRVALEARPGDARLTFQLARALQKDGRAAALTEAVRLYQFAADRGHVIGLYNLGQLYETGRGGLPKSDDEAARLYRLTADQGLALAQLRLGSFYETGHGGLPKDDEEAARLYRLAAEQGLPYAQTRLGSFFETGRGGLPKSDEKAVRLYRRAAEQGLAYAQTRFGSFFETGRGGLEKNIEEAVRLYKLAADQGDDAAKNALARTVSGSR